MKLIMKKTSTQLKLSAAACVLTMAAFALQAPLISGAADAATATSAPMIGMEGPSLPVFPVLLPR